MAYPVEELAKHDQLATLRKIIESGARYPRVRLGDYLRLNTDRIQPGDFPETRFRVLGVSNTDGVFLNETKPGAEIRQANYRVKPNEFCYNPYRVNVGSIGLCEFDYDNQIISGAYNIFGTDETELLPHYLLALFKSPQFLDYVNAKAHGGVRMNFQFEDLEEWEIPLPPVELQHALVTETERKYSIIAAAKVISTNSRIDLAGIEAQYEPVELSSVIQESLYGTSDKAEYGDSGFPVLRIGNVGFCDFDLRDLKRVSMTEAELRKYSLREGDFLIVRSNGNPALVGKCAVWPGGSTQYVYASYLIRFRFASDKVLPRFVMYYLMSDHGRSLLSPQQGGGTYNLSATALQAVKIAIPPLSMQAETVKRLDAELCAIRAVEAMKESLQDRIAISLCAVWET
jgi:restriction endonuclease S subunit